MSMPRVAMLLALLLAASTLRAGTFVQMDTSVGSMVFELYDVEKPQTTQLFLNWLAAGNYNGTYVHRATNDYLAQAGRYGVQDFGPPFGKLNIELPISPNGGVPNETFNANFIPNTYGTISMVPWTPVSTNTYVTSGFIFNLADNEKLDDVTTGGGFPVFGQIVSGQDIFALLNPTNGNPALRVTNFSDTLPELPVRAATGPSVTYDDLIYLNMHVVPEPGTVALLGLAALAGFAWRKMKR
ncbi:MAG: peptidylprolyl isomerase [Verrucomicrobia bacterium]|nr:peptidylprolyl isomerase [Verrucomicrobiota bacterium]